jgi:hypothetical protein
MNWMCSEMRELIDASGQFLAGEMALTDLRAFVVQAELSSSVKDDVNVGKALLELRRLLDETWNEWGMSRSPLLRSEFDALLSIQIDSWRIDSGAEPNFQRPL